MLKLHDVITVLTIVDLINADRNKIQAHKKTR